MAARVNTKLILILAVSLFGAVGVIGGLWFLQMRGDASRAARIGDEYFAQGDLEKAKDYYERAVGRAPGNIDYIEKLEDAILLFKPGTTDEAALWYNAWLNVLRQRAVNFPDDGVSQLRLLTELYHVARRSNLGGYWQRLADEAEGMLVRMSPSDPHRPHAETLANAARIRLGQNTLTLEELSEAEENLRLAVSRIPHEDFAWAALLISQNSVNNRSMQNAQDLAREEKRKELLANVDQAEQAIPDGLDTTKAILLSLGVLRGEASDDTDTLKERIASEIDRLVLLAQSEEASPEVVLESANLLTAFPDEDGGKKALGILESFLGRNPDALDLRMVKAKMHFNRREMDASLTEASTALQTPELSVSYLAIFQKFHQRDATSLIGGIAFVRWQEAAADEKSAHVDAMKAARRTFEGIVIDTDTDPMVMKLDGLIAFASADYQTAVSMFEKLLQTQGGMDAQTLVFDAQSLEKIGQLGRAHQRVGEALQLLPGNMLLALDKARLELLMGRYDEATRTTREVLRTSPEHAKALAMLDTIAASQTTERSADDVRIIATLQSADAALSRGETDIARSVLLNALSNNPGHLALIQKMIAVESGAGDLEAANRYLSQGLEIAPRNTRLLQIKATLTSSDPVEALERFAELAYENELNRAVALLYNFNSMSIRQDGLAQRLENDGDAEAAEEARDIAIKARQVAGNYLRTVEQSNPDHPALIDYLYTLAISEKDWEAAEAQIQRAQILNLDHAGGAVYQGRYEMARRQYRKAMQSLKQATRIVHYSSTVWKTFAMACEGAGEYSEARRAYGEAYECNPTDVEIARRYANILERVGDKTRALRILSDTYNLAPNNIALREEWLNLEEEVGSLTDVLRTRLRHYQLNTRDYINTANLAELFGYATPTRIMLLDEKGEELYSATNWNQRTALEQRQILAQSEEQWQNLSIQLLDELEETYPDPFSIVSLRAGIFRKRGQIEDGNQVFLTYLEQLNPEEVTLDMRMTYASYLRDIDRASESIVVLQEAVGLQDPLRRGVDSTIAETYFQLRQFERAIPYYERIREVSDNREISLRLIDCFVNTNEFEKAEETLAGLGESGETEFTLSLVRASIAHRRGENLYREGKADEAQQKFQIARAALRNAQSLNKDNPEPHLRLAQNYLSEFQLTRNQEILISALAAVDRAERLDPVGLMIDELRSDLLRARGDLAGAINELVDVLRGNAANSRARQKLIQLRVNAGNGEEAMRLTREGIRLDPNTQLWHILLGDLMYSFRGDVDGAIQEYTEAYSIRKEATTLVKLITAKLMQEPADYQAIEGFISSESESIRAYPSIQTLYARALHGLGRTQEARDWMQTSYESYQQAFARGDMATTGIAKWFGHLLMIFPPEDPDAIESLTMELCNNRPNVHELRGLSTIYLQQADSFETYKSHIIDLQRRAIEVCPVGDIILQATIHSELATTFIKAKRYGDAAEVYERVLELTPNNVFIMNNYAYLLADFLGRAEDALVFAKAAVERNPQNIDLLDTLGWVYFKLGQYQLAARNLEVSLSTRESLSSNLHMAEVMVKLGDLDGATARLQKAQRFPLDEQTRAEIDRLNDDIQLARGQGDR